MINLDVAVPLGAQHDAACNPAEPGLVRGAAALSWPSWRYGNTTSNFPVWSGPRPLEAGLAIRYSRVKARLADPNHRVEGGRPGGNPSNSQRATVCATCAIASAVHNHVARGLACNRGRLYWPSEVKTGLHGV